MSLVRGTPARHAPTGVGLYQPGASDATENRHKYLQIETFDLVDGRIFARLGGLVATLRARWLLLATVVVGGVLALSAAPGRGAPGAAPAHPAQVEAQRQAGALQRAESSALLQLYAAESELARARSTASSLHSRSQMLRQEEASVQRRTQIVQRALALSQQRLASLLRTLYVEGSPDPIAIILGASSIDEAVTGIDELARAAALNRGLAAEAAGRARSLARLRSELVRRRSRLDAAVSASHAATARLTAAVSARQQTVASIRSRRSFSERRLIALQTRAQAAERRSETLTGASTQQTTTAAVAETDAGTTTVAQPAPARASAPAGTHALVVDAVAYHLPGNTASGLPVGVGVVAVDPTVIPLGTRLFVPGYGPAVAADVGSAVKGAIIDLWMPSTKQALAWGRRTVTITVYG